MAIKKLNLTEDIISLIQNIKFETFDINDRQEDHHFGWGIDQYSLFGGTFVMEDIALILGKFDQYVPGTEESPMGRQYPKVLEDYWWELYDYIWVNMEYIISLVLWSVKNGGLTPGTYKCIDTIKDWKKED